MGDSILRELLYGKGAHVDPVACVEDVSADVAARALAGYPHSIWQIVAHMNYWMDYDLGTIAGDIRPYPEKAIESWPENPDPADDNPSNSNSESRIKDEQWQALIRRFADLLARLELAAGCDTAELARRVTRLGPGQTSRESIVDAMLWQIAAHNSYHTGQIALLRRVFGAWPPRRGGDTW
jgi:DinB superfamily